MRASRPRSGRLLTSHLDLKNAVHVGHSTGGSEVPPRNDEFIR